MSHPSLTPACPVSLTCLQDDVLLQLDKMEQLVSKGSGPPETSRRYASCIHRRWQGIWLTACSKGCQ